MFLLILFQNLKKTTDFILTKTPKTNSLAILRQNFMNVGLMLVTGHYYPFTHESLRSACKARAKTRFEFLGFEFKWTIGRSRKPLLKWRTSRTKLRASIANFKTWFKKYSGLPKKILFAKLNRKLLGYYNYYGVTGNSQSLSTFVYHVTNLLYKWLNRRSQCKSYNWIGFKELHNYFGIAKPRIYHAL